MERVFNTRLNEFTDPTDYAATDNDTADRLRQIEKLWPSNIGDDDATSPVYLTKPNANWCSFSNGMCRYL